MRCIPKQKPILTESVKLKEAEVNPLENAVKDTPATELYAQAIIKALASESSAEVEYTQILSLEDKCESWIVDMFHDTLTDIRNEEIKHIAQLTEKISQLPNIKEDFDKGTEEAKSGKDISESVTELKEAVQDQRLYDTWKIEQVIAEELGLTDKQYELVEDIFRHAEDELTPQEVDNYLIELRKIFTISDAKFNRLENAIIATDDPINDRKNEFKDDIDSDISSIENIMDNVYSIAAKEQLYKVIQYLRALEYNGEKEIGWNTSHSIFGGRNPKKKIVA